MRYSSGYTLGVAEMQAPLGGKTAGSVSLGSSANPERGQDKLGSPTLTIFANPVLTQLSPELQVRI